MHAELVFVQLPHLGAPRLHLILRVLCPQLRHEISLLEWDAYLHRRHAGITLKRSSSVISDILAVDLWCRHPASCKVG